MSSILLILLLGDTYIRMPAGHFDYTDFNGIHHVFEGEVISSGTDSIGFTVTRVWRGDLAPEQQIALFSDFPVHLEHGSRALVSADSTGELLCYGTKGNGFFIMSGRASPNVLTVDDLEQLSRGETPDFNEHVSIITLHFPLTGDTTQFRVVPGDRLRRAISGIDVWNGAYVLGNLFQGPRGSTEMVLYPSTAAFRDREALGTFSGEVNRYEEGVYYIDMWPMYPCYPSLRSVIEPSVSLTGPLYCFDVEFDNRFMWMFGMPDETFILSDGRGFHMLDGKGEFLSSSVMQRDGMGLAFNEMVFGTSGMDMGLMPEGHVIFSFDEMTPGPHMPRLSWLIERCARGTITGTFALNTEAEAGPVTVSDFRVSLDSPEFQLQVPDSASAAADLHGSFLVFLEDGSALIEHGGYQYSQENLQLRVPRTHHTSYPFSMVFGIPGSPDSYIALALPGLGHVWSGAGADRTVAAQLLGTCLAEGYFDCQLWSYHRLEDSYVRLGDCRLSIR